VEFFEKHGDAFLELEVTVVIKYFIGFVFGTGFGIHGKGREVVRP
jgi:hypothetical protein